jgi:hypothetical protein
MDLSQLSAWVETMMMVAEAKLLNFPLRDVLDLNCWLATMPAPKLDAQGIRLPGTDASASLAMIAASVSSLKMNLTCIECTSPKMLKLADLVSAPPAQDEVTRALNGMLDYVGQLAGGAYAQVQIDRILNDAALKCPHSPTYDPNFVKASYQELNAPQTKFDISQLIRLAGVAVGLIFASALIIFAVRFVVHRRHKKWLSRLPPHQIRALARQQGKERQGEEGLNATSKSMFTSPEIPLFVRWIMPLVILGNIGFFLTGHLSLGATVQIDADIAGEKFKDDNFF